MAEEMDCHQGHYPGPTPAHYAMQYPTPALLDDLGLCYFSVPWLRFSKKCPQREFAGFLDFQIYGTNSARWQ
jgi:hypothetical protein